MNNLLQGLPGVLKAVTDPFSLLALITIVLGFVAYSAIRKSPTVKAAGLPAPILALAIVAISFVALAFNIIRMAMPRGPAAVSPGDQINLRVLFAGQVKKTIPVTVPFSVSSGQLNVGCGDSALTSVSWTLPPAAKEINDSATWQKTDGLKNSSPGSIVVQGSVITATGSITGQDRQWTGNCPGGGHGELVLAGSYIIDQPSTTQQISFPALQSPVSPGALTEVDIPQSAAISNLLCRVEAATSKTDQSASVYSIGPSIAGSRPLVRMNKEGNKTIDVYLSGEKLFVKVS